MSRLARLVLCLAFACGSAHEVGERDGGSPPDACAPGPDRAAYADTACSPASFEFEPFGPVDLSPGPCIGDEVPTTTPFVLVGVWSNLQRERLLRSACSRITAADPGTGLRVGAVLEDRIVRFVVPYDRVGFEVEMVGLDECGQVLGQTLRIDSTDHQPPRMVLRSDEPIVALPDRVSTGRFFFATATHVYSWRDGSVRSERESVMPRDLLPNVEGRDVWVEGSSTGAALTSDPFGSSPPVRIPVDGTARAVRWWSTSEETGEPTQRIVLLEPGLVRILAPEDLREERAFEVPMAADDPVVHRSELALGVDGTIRLFDLRTGAEIVGRGFEPGDRLLHARPPLLLRDQRLSAVAFEEGLLVPTWFDRSAARLEPVLETTGPVRSVVSFNFNGMPVMVTGERAVAAVLDPETSLASSPPARTTTELFGGPVRLARTVWQWRTWAVVDAGPGSLLFEMRHGLPGWRRDCPQFD